jgi:Capsule assembly protein Wzi
MLGWGLRLFRRDRIVPRIAVLSAVLTATVALTVTIPPRPTAWAGDRTNIPLKNWGGFSQFRDATYDDLERLVTAGLADRTLLNTKPLSRIEAARIVARAIDRIRRDEPELNARRDLEPVLDRLMEEFKSELAGLGVRAPGDAVAPGFVSFTPVDRLQLSSRWTNHTQSMVNEQGRTFQKWLSGGPTFESRLQLGDFLTFYLQPELTWSEDDAAARLASGYVKLTLWNVELLVGRDSLFWGPGYHNGLMISNNAQPLDQIRLGAAEPFLLPWIGQWVGPMKALIFLAELEERRDHSHAKLAGMRLTFSPATFLELGASRMVMFNGGPKYLSLGKYPEAIFDPSFGDDPTRPEERTNSLTGIDAELRFRNVDRYLLPSRDLRVYGEFYWDDTCGECGPSSGIGHFFASNFLPLGSTIGAVGGLHWIGLFGHDWLEARFEYARSSSQSYNHAQFISGYWTRGHVISDFIGTDGQDFYGRISARITPNLMLGLTADRATIGSTVAEFPGPQERRLGGGFDVSYRWDRYSLFAQYLVSDVKNRRFRAGDDGLDHLVRLELTRSFR